MTPFLKYSSDQPGAERTMQAPDYRETVARDQQLAKDLGYERPYVRGEHFGTCPGTAGSQIGDGLTARTVHGGACCERWDAGQAERPTRGELIERAARQFPDPFEPVDREAG